MEMFNKEFTRKDMLKMSLLGSAALFLPLERAARTGALVAGQLTDKQLPAPFQEAFAVPPVAKPKGTGIDPSTGLEADYYEMTMQAPSVQFFPKSAPKLKTRIYGYEGITPGPTLSCRRGRPIVVRHINNLPDPGEFGYPQWTSVHLHGSASLPEYDGYASDITKPGEFKDYHYPNIQPARTLWYHDHGVHHTAQGAYMGMAAQYHLHDPLEDSLPIPKSYGKYDNPLILKDVGLNQDGSLVYNDNSEAGLYGNVILVNGVPWPVMKVERRKYRFRVLNAAVSRSFKPALSTGQPMTVIATDGGLMPAPKPVKDFRIGMAERYEIVIDFSQNKIGDQVVLQNLGPPNNINFTNTNKIMRFDVVSEATDTTDNEIPSVLNTEDGKVQPAWQYNPMFLDKSKSVKTRDFIFKRSTPAGSTSEEWTVNGTTWEDVINSNYNFTSANPGVDDVEIWNITNTGGGWFHPVHIHLIDFKVLSRNGTPISDTNFPHEQGGKDVVYVGEGETVSVMMKFGPQKGKYMMHCHNLVHEDHDMMTQFEVGTGGHDPINADPAKKYDAANPPAPSLQNYKPNAA